MLCGREFAVVVIGLPACVLPGAPGFVRWVGVGRRCEVRSGTGSEASRPKAVGVCPGPVCDGIPEAAETVAVKAAEKLQPFLHDGAVPVTALYGSLLLLGAIAAARHGEAWKARDRIRHVAPLATHTGECNAYWTAFGPTNVAMFTVSVEVESGEAVEGLRLAEHVDHDRSPSIERRVAFLIDQAKGYEQRRDFARALTLLTAAEKEAPEDIQYRPAAHTVLRSVVKRGRGHVAAEASRLALRVGLPL